MLYNYFGVLLILLYSSTRGFSFSCMASLIFFVCIADCQSSRNLKPTLLQIFQVFLTTGNFAFYMSTTIAWIQFFYFLFSCYFSYIKGSTNINAHLSMKIILVGPNFGNSFFDHNYGAHPWKYFCAMVYNKILRALN